MWSSPAKLLGVTSSFLELKGSLSTFEFPIPYVIPADFMFTQPHFKFTHLTWLSTNMSRSEPQKLDDGLSKRSTTIYAEPSWIFHDVISQLLPRIGRVETWDRWYAWHQLYRRRYDGLRDGGSGRWRTGLNCQRWRWGLLQRVWDDCNTRNFSLLIIFLYVSLWKMSDVHPQKERIIMFSFPFLHILLFPPLHNKSVVILVDTYFGTEGVL